MRNFRWLSLESSLIHSKDVRVAQNDCTLDHILQLGNVSRPRIRLQEPQRFLVDAYELLPNLLSKASDEILDQQGDIGCPFAQRGHLQRDHVQPVGKILAELAFAHKLLEIAMGSG